MLLKPDAQPQDRFAIAVWTGDDRYQVGFLPSNVAAEVMADSMRDRLGLRCASWPRRSAIRSPRSDVT